MELNYSGAGRVRKPRGIRLLCWKPFPEDWGEKGDRKLSACCSELEKVWISDNPIVKCNYEL
jgi:hypothetical protein